MGMRIGIITDSIDDGIIDPSARTGIFTYTSQLVAALLRIDNNNEYVLIHHSNLPFASYTDGMELLVAPNKLPFGREFRKTITLPMSVRREKGIDVIHEPRSFIPWLLPSNVARILTVHDLSTIVYPSLHGTLNEVRTRLSLAMSVGKIDRIIAVSNFTKNELMREFRMPSSAISVVYEGVDPSFRRVDNCGSVLNKYGLERGYILYVGTIEPRKNLETAMKAFYKLKRMNICRKFVLAGARGWKLTGFYKTIRELHLFEDIRILGSIAQSDLPALYSGSALFVYPSIYEGFGLPVLEAMACGTPVLTSNSSSLPEVVGDAAAIVSPLDVDGMASAMREILTDDGLAREMAKMGIRRSQQFSWDETARKTIRVYEEAHGLC
jgi:glycosyltransferase involved in cell wall biosynthesis